MRAGGVLLLHSDRDLCIWLRCRWPVGLLGGRGHVDYKAAHLYVAGGGLRQHRQARLQDSELLACPDQACPGLGLSRLKLQDLLHTRQSKRRVVGDATEI